MKTILPFIDAGWHTVPLRGLLERQEDGSKTVPQFERDWKNTYTKQFNTLATPLGGALTGQISNIIAIDCDDQLTLDMFMSLDPGYTNIFHSVGKPSGGGTLIYRWSPTAPMSFQLHSAMLQLDFYNNDGFIYLPTAANRTKQSVATVIEAKEMPALIERLLANLHEQYALSKGQATKKVIAATTVRYQRPMVEQLVSKKLMDKSMGSLTPKDFRTLSSYKEKGWLHPDEVPEGRGSEYLIKVSAILGADSSIDEDLYLEAMSVINSMWSTPLPTARLQQTILHPMVSGAAQIGGVSIWSFDPEWTTKGFSFESKLNETYDCFFDDTKVTWYTLNATSNALKTFDAPAKLLNFVEGTALVAVKKAALLRSIPIVRTVVTPALPEGFIDGPIRMFNLFSRTEELDILLDYTVYTKYAPPVVTLKFIESLVPDTATRNYLLSWVKRKLTLFEYSPVVPYLLGAAGSGKDTFVNILRRFMGENAFAKPSAAEFCSQYNGWLESSYFVHLDEYGDQLSKHDKDIAKGRIKAYTGSASAQIRRMNNDGYEVKHNATFIMTANKNALEFDIDDRRFFYIKTPAALASQDWVMAYGGVAAVVATIAKESKDFAYYLATEVAMLDATAYTTPLASAEKLDLIANSLPPLTRLAMFIKHRNWKSLETLLLDYNVALNDIVDVRDRVYWEKLVEVSQAFFPNGASSNLLSRELSSLGIEKIRTSRLKAGKTVHAFYIDTAGLFAYSTDKVFTIKEDENYG